MNDDHVHHPSQSIASLVPVEHIAHFATFRPHKVHLKAKWVGLYVWQNPSDGTQPCLFNLSCLEMFVIIDAFTELDCRTGSGISCHRWVSTNSFADV